MQTVSAQTAVKTRHINQRNDQMWKRDLPWMSFVSALGLTSLWEDADFLLVILSTAALCAGWSWPGGTAVNCPDGVSSSSRSASVLGFLNCVVNLCASLSLLNRGLTVCLKESFISPSCVKVSGFWDVATGLEMLPAETVVFATGFCGGREAKNISDRLTVSHCFSLVSVSSEPLVSHPGDDTTLLLFFCDFTLMHEPDFIPHARFFAFNIQKQHFSLRFLHIQSCNLQYNRLLARRERWETPLTEDVNPFFLFKYLRQWFCVRCIMELDLRVSLRLWWLPQ